MRNVDSNSIGSTMHLIALTSKGTQSEQEGDSGSPELSRQPGFGVDVCLSRHRTELGQFTICLSSCGGIKTAPSSESLWKFSAS